VELKENNVVVSKSLTTKAKFIPFGFIPNAHGLKGEVLVALDSGEPLEPFPTTLYASQTPSIQNDLQMLKVKSIRWAHKGPIIHFHGYSQRSHAEALKGLTLYFNSETFQSEHFHLLEVLDFLVQIQVGGKVKNLGYVSHFISHSHQDLLVVKYLSAEKDQSFKNTIKYSIMKNKKQVEIPFVSSYVQSIDFKERKMVLKLPEGFPGIDDYAV